MDNIIKLIQQRKKTLGVTTSQLAQSTNIAVGTLNKILSGATKSIKSSHLASIAKELSLSLDSLTPDSTSNNAPYLGFCKIASVTLDIKLGNAKQNAIDIVESITELASKGVSLACYAELGITGYTVGDLLYCNTLQQSALDGLQYIITNTKHLDILYVVGLPICWQSRLYNCAVAVHKGKILAVVPKTNLPNYNEFYEKRWFYPAPPTVSDIELLGQTVPFGTDIIISNSRQPSIRLSIEICEDVWVASPPSSRHTNNGANIIFNLSASPDWVGKAEYRRTLVNGQSARCICAYVYTSAGIGESTTDLVFGGHNIISENGTTLAEASLFSNSTLITEIDTLALDNERNKRHNLYQTYDNYTNVYYDSNVANATTLSRTYSKTPWLVTPIADYTKSVMHMQSTGLRCRLNSINCNSMVLGVSGGLDSTLALLVAVQTADSMGIARSNIHAYTMPCFGTSSRTSTNASKLCQLLGVTTHNADITEAVENNLKLLEHDQSTDTTFENIQARQRTMILMNSANKYNAIVIGTGDMSEIALGWSTYNGDHMSMYNVNGGVVKTSIKAMLAQYASHTQTPLKEVLLDILATPISPELLPTNGQLTQKTEEIIGPYELHDFFLHCIVGNNYTISKTLFVTNLTFDNYSLAEIYKWLKVFIKRFFSNQYKRNCSADGVKTSYMSLSPRGDWKMSSDVDSTIWLEELERSYNDLSNN